jgi:hypothetical protein
MLGNVVLWKPSPMAVLSNYIVYQIFREAGLPAGVIQFVPGAAERVCKTAFASTLFSALHFTGSTKVTKLLVAYAVPTDAHCLRRYLSSSGGTLPKTWTCTAAILVLLARLVCSVTYMQLYTYSNIVCFQEERISISSVILMDAGGFLSHGCQTDSSFCRHKECSGTKRPRRIRVPRSVRKRFLCHFCILSERDSWQAKNALPCPGSMSLPLSGTFSERNSFRRSTSLP